MIRWFKKHFIPHEGNDHQPHFLRDKNIRFLTFAVFTIELAILALPITPFLYQPDNNFLAAILPGVLDSLTNQNRIAQHLPALTVSPLLNKVAQLKAEDMASKGYFAHTSPNGKSPWYWFNLVGYNYEYAGENLAVDFTDSIDVDVAWMNSPEHRANILKYQYTQIGTGIATGTYQGTPTVFIAQEFGTPAPVSVENAVAIASRPFVAVATSTASTSKAPTLSSEVMGVSVSAATNTQPLSARVASNSVATLTPVTLATVAPPSVVQPPTNQSNIFEEYITSPRHVVNDIMVILGVIVIVALVLKLFIRIDKKHPILITNGFVLLVVIFSVYVANSYLTKVNLTSTTSFASFQNNHYISGN